MLYKSAQRRYLSFCELASITQPYPLREETLCRYVSFLADQSLKHRTTKSYLSGIRFAQIHQGLKDPFAEKTMPLLEYTLLGVKRAQAKQLPAPKPRLPITPVILAHLQAKWTQPATAEGLMLWAAACTGFFGFLRTAEFTVPSPRDYDKSVHLNLEDVALDDRSAPKLVQLNIKQSKTDPFRMGTKVYMGKTGLPICPVRAMTAYLATRSPQPGPLFIFPSGEPLTRTLLVRHLHQALQQAGFNASSYNGHSFRIGAATTAAKCGVEDSLIRTLGRWKSSAYLTYIKIPGHQLAAISPALLKEGQP